MRFAKRTLKTRKSPHGVSADLLCTDAQAATKSEQGGPAAIMPCGWSLAKTQTDRRRRTKYQRRSKTLYIYIYICIM